MNNHNLDSFRHECAYKAVISLNNAGASLLSRRMYTDAVETLKDAIHLMRSSFFSGDNENAALPSQQAFEQALQAAWHRTRQEVSGEQDGLSLEVLSDLGSPLQVYEELGNNSETLFAVVIEPSDWSDMDTERLECESGLLLYNYGIAHRCAALTDPTMDPDTRSRVEEAALRIFELSQTVASKSTVQSDDEYPLTTTSTEILLSFLVTASLLQMSSNNRELCHQYREDLLDLLTMLSRREIMHSLENVICAAAAA